LWVFVKTYLREYFDIKESNRRIQRKKLNHFDSSHIILRMIYVRRIGGPWLVAYTV
jgi:hypothetical protein